MPAAPVSAASSAAMVQAGRELITTGVFRGSDLLFSRGKGSYLYTTEDKPYLDYTCGIAVTNLGHCHPRVVDAAQTQLQNLFHGQINVGNHVPQIAYLEKLRTIVPHRSKLNTFLYANSGSEALENCIKIARRHTGRSNVIVMQGAFHGRTFGAMSLTNSKTVYSRGFGSLLAGVYTTPFPYFHRGQSASRETVDSALHSLKLVLKQRSDPKDTAAIIIEPILGEGGYVPADSRYLQGVRQICDENGILMVVDEVQSGFGRSGDWFAIEESGVVPDIMAMAKGIANGLPLSVVVGRKEVMNSCDPGSLGGTYTGNVVSCAAASAVIDVFNEENILQNVRDRSEQMVTLFNEDTNLGKAGLTLRGRGLMLALEFPTEYSVEDEAASRQVSTEVVLAEVKSSNNNNCKIYERGVASRVAAEMERASSVLVLTTSVFDTLRIIPPLNTTAEEVTSFVAALSSAVANIAK